MKPQEPSLPANQPPAEFEDAVIWATWLYYEDQLTQSEIAKLLGVSRASIVNYLQEARQRGIVRVLMNAEIATRTRISRRLAAKYGLQEALVIPDKADLTGHGSESAATSRSGEAQGATMAALGAGGARLIERMIRPGDTICVSWGRTILAVAEALDPPRPVEGLSVVQVTGSSMGKRQFSAEFCTSIMARKLDAVGINLTAPAVLSSADLREALMREPVLQRQFELIGKSDLIVFGVGTLNAESTMRIAEVTDNAEIDHYAEAGATAVLICRFIDPEGRQIVRDFDRRVTGIELDHLRAIPRRLCVAGGAHKMEAILAVLKGGYATHLVTDMAAAELLLAE